MIDNSPRPIAAFHVLHRLIMPKASTVRPSQTTQNTKTPTHQPHINNKHVHDSQRVNNNDFKQKITKKKILASTIQFSNNTNTHNKPMKHSSAHHKHPQKRNNRLSQTPNSHDKPTNNFANPNTVPTPTHNTLTISPTPTRGGAHLLPSSTQQPPQKMIEPVTYSPRNKTKKYKNSLERR